MDTNTTFSKLLVVLWFFCVLLQVVYIFLVPPWQQNDEPGNFEYAWLLGNVSKDLDVGFYLPSTRREIASSMVESNFYQGVNLISVTSTISIGPEQIGSPKSYFVLVGLILRLLRGFDITFQLYVSRFISFLFLCFITFISYKVAIIFFEEKLPVIWTVLFVAVTPGVVDKLLGVNDDVWATLSVTIVIWMAVSLLKKGIHFWNTVGMIAGIIACALSKGTAWPAIPIGIFVIILAAFWRRRVYVWLAFTVALLIGVYIIFTSGSTIVAYFYSYPTERVMSMAAPAGKNVMRIESGTSALQVLSKDKVSKLSGKYILVGAYMWGDEKSNASMPVVVADDVRILGISNQVQISTIPTLKFVSGIVPPSAKRISLHLFTDGIPSSKSLYLDCMFMIVLEQEVENIDSISHDEECKFITINQVNYYNFIKNASAELGWPLMRPEFANMLYKTGYVRSQTDIWAFFDMSSPYDYYIMGAAANLFRTYWGGFGWGGIRLLGNKPYRLFLILTVIAVAGNLVSAIRNLKKNNWSLILLLAILVFSIFIFAIARAISNFYAYTFMPTARYFLPVAVIVSLFFSNGLFTLLHDIINIRSKYMLFFSFPIFFVYNVWAWLSILWFFRGNS